VKREVLYERRTTETLFIVTESSYFSEYLMNFTVLRNFKSVSQVFLSCIAT